MHESGIYEIRNLVNGKRYVGSAVRFSNRWRVHAQSLARGDHHSRALQRAWVHYSPAAFQFNKLLICSKENLIMYEQICMDTLKPEYNCAPKAGSQLGFKHHPEARARMSAANNRQGNPGYVHTPESKAKISAAKKGVPSVPCSDEKKAKLSAIHKGRVITQEQRAKISATLTGHKQSAEQIEKRMQKLRGRKMPEGFAEAASARMLGKKHSAETLQKMARSRSKLTDDQVREVRSRIASGEKQRAIGLAMGVSHSAVADIGSGRRYKWVAL
jgi:group I intron endonuclease